MTDIGKLQAQIIANPSGFQSGLATAASALTSFVNTATAQLNSFGGVATNAISAIAGGKVGGAIGSVTSMLSGLLTMGTAGAMGVAGVVVAAIAGAAAFAHFGQEGISLIGTQARLGRQLGISTRDMLGLSFAAEASGVAVEDQARLFGQFLRRTGQLRQHMAGTMMPPGQPQLPDGVAPPPMPLMTGSNGAEHDQMANGLRQLGINARQFAALDTIGQLRMIAGGMELVTNSSDRAAIAFQVFGRGGQDAMRLVGRGLSSFEEQMAAGAMVGGVLSDSDIARMEAAAKAMKQVGIMIDAIGRSLKLMAGATIAPIVSEFNSLLLSTLKPMQTILAVMFLGVVISLAPLLAAVWLVFRALQLFSPVIEGIAIIFTSVKNAVMSVVNAFAPIGTLISNIWSSLNLGGTAAGIVVTAFTKIGLVIEIIGAIVAAVFSAIISTVMRVWQTITGLFANMLDSLDWGPLVSNVMETFATVKGIVTDVFMFIYNLGASLAGAFTGKGAVGAAQSTFSRIMSAIRPFFAWGVTVWTWFSGKALAAYQIIRAALVNVLIPAFMYFIEAVKPVFSALWDFISAVFDNIMASASAAWTAIKVAALAAFAVLYVVASPFIEVMKAIFGADVLDRWLTGMSDGGMWLNLMKNSIDNMLMPVMLLANEFRRVASIIEIMTEGLVRATAQAEQLAATTRGMVLGPMGNMMFGSTPPTLPATPGVATPDAMAKQTVLQSQQMPDVVMKQTAIPQPPPQPPAGFFSGLMARWFSPGGVVPPTPGTPATPKPGMPSTAQAASRDSIEAVTAIIQNSLQPADTRDPADRTTDAVKEVKTVLEQIKTLLGNQPQLAKFDMGGQ